MRVTKILLAFLAVMLVSGVVFADIAPKEEFKEKIPVVEPEVPVVMETCSWGARFSAGVPVWFFRDEDTAASGGVYLDVFPCELPINLRVGAEVRHMGISQDNALAYVEQGEKEAKITYVRIPISAEYFVSLMDRTSLYLTIGPDLVRTANDISDFTVGMHLGARLMYEFENNISLSVEGGYMWAEVKDDGPKVNLDGAYIIPTIGYRF